MAIAPSGEPDAEYTLDRGVGLLYDPPTVLVVIDGIEAPRRLRKVADAVVMFDGALTDRGNQSTIMAAVEQVMR